MTSLTCHMGSSQPYFNFLRHFEKILSTRPVGLLSNKAKIACPCIGQYLLIGKEMSNLLAESSANDTFNNAKKCKIDSLFEKIFQKQGVVP